MTPLSRDYIGSTCHLKNQQNDLLTTGVIRKIDDEGLDIVGASDEKMLLIPYDTTVKINIFHSTLGLQILMGVVYTSSEHILRLVQIETLGSFERRVFFRVNVRMRARLYPIKDPFLNAVGEENEPAFEVLIENISLSGLMISTPRIFVMGDKFDIEVQLFKDIMKMRCQVCRFDQPNGLNKRYGCMYLDQSQRQADNLCKDLFQLQRIELKKRKEII